MPRASHKFRPPLWATLGLVVACLAFSRAGMWQLDRADEKRAIFAAFDNRAAYTELAAPVADDDLGENLYRSLRITGRYDATHQILLDSMVRDGKAGYHVLTPLQLEDRAVLVNRGWVPAGKDRTQLPDVAVPVDAREVTGAIAPLPEPGMRLGGAQPEDGWPKRMNFPTVASIAATLDYPIAGYQLLLNPDQADGFARDWRPELKGPETHLSYAAQWFGFAVALTVIYIGVNLKRSPGED